jgi:stage V sporulation protein D (sporulation-specific penicillin-binding protein)
MLEYTVSSGGSRVARIEGLRVLGKTGTAQKINPDTGKYEFYVSSFVGAAPADDPKISIFVAVDEPGTDRTLGSQVAAPLAKKIMEASIEYLKSPQN